MLEPNYGIATSLSPLCYDSDRCDQVMIFSSRTLLLLEPIRGQAKFVPTDFDEF